MKSTLLRVGASLLLFSHLTAAPFARASAEGDDLRAADAELNRTYQATLDAMPGAAAKTRLREAQRAWIAYRDAEVALYAEMGTGGGGLKITQTELTEERTKRLQGIATDARSGTVQ